MTREQILEILMLLSALESWGFSNNQRLPDFIHDRLSKSIDDLSKWMLR